jgi:hypothetical protein
MDRLNNALKVKCKALEPKLIDALKKHMASPGT